MLQVKVNIGELDKKITFIKKVIGSNDFNEDEEESWVLVDLRPTVYAKVSQRPGKEMLIADRITYVQSTMFTIRSRADITVMNRVVYGGKPYDIISITENNSSRDMYIDILAKIVDNEEWT